MADYRDCAGTRFHARRRLCNHAWPPRGWRSARANRSGRRPCLPRPLFPPVPLPVSEVGTCARPLGNPGYSGAISALTTPTRVTAGIQPFGYHLRAYEHIGLVDAELVKCFLVGVLACGDIAVPAQHPGSGEGCSGGSCSSFSVPVPMIADSLPLARRTDGRRHRYGSCSDGRPGAAPSDDKSAGLRSVCI